jgi:hypothetical protein
VFEKNIRKVASTQYLYIKIPQDKPCNKPLSKNNRKIHELKNKEMWKHKHPLIIQELMKKFPSLIKEKCYLPKKTKMLT